MMSKLERVELTEKQAKARKGRSFALAVLLIAFVLIVYVLTVVKIGPSILDRGL